MEKLRAYIERFLSAEGQKPLVISIEGSSGAGKSSLAAELAKSYPVTLIHMDHYFLPPELRTEKRLAEAGGNVHYERFLEEVVEPLREAKAGLRNALHLRVFDCAVMSLGDAHETELKPLIIVEGVYSQHPYFEDYSDLKVFLNLEKETQRERIKARETASKQERFFNEWIPMEERYFAKFSIKEKADLQISVS